MGNRDFMDWRAEYSRTKLENNDVLICVNPELELSF